jgi:hypothetical protein
MKRDIHRLFAGSLTMASDDTDYTVDIPHGCQEFSVRMSDTTKTFRVGFTSVAAVGAGFPMAAGEAFVIRGPAMRNTLHISHTAGGSIDARWTCEVPVVR